MGLLSGSGSKSDQNTDLLQNTTGNYAMDSIIEGINASISSINKGVNTAANTLNQGLDKTNSYLTDYLAKSTATLAPLSSAAYSALDSYYDALGIPRPSQGSQSYAESQKQSLTAQNNLDKLTSTNTDLQKQLEGLSAQAQSLVGKPGTTQDMLDTISNQARSVYAQMQQNNKQIDTYKQQISSIQSGDQSAMTKPDSTSVLQNLRNTPGWQARFQAGQAAVQNSAAARGTLNSSGSLMGMTNFGQNLADTVYNENVSQKAAAFNATSPAISAIAGNQMTTGQNLGQSQQNVSAQQAANAITGATSVANAYVGGASAISDLYAKKQDSAAIGAAAAAGGTNYAAGAASAGAR